MLVISSSDGYCSIVAFAAGELGSMYEKEVVPAMAKEAVEVKAASPVSHSIPVSAPAVATSIADIAKSAAIAAPTPMVDIANSATVTTSTGTKKRIAPTFLRSLS